MMDLPNISYGSWSNHYTGDSEQVSHKAENVLCESVFADTEYKLIDRRTLRSGMEAFQAICYFIEGW